MLTPDIPRGSWGFSTGTTLSIQLNKTWRQASLIAHMLGQFTVDEVGLDMLDDGTPGGLAALEAHFRAAVTHVAQGAVGTNYLPLSGGTLTGPLQINANTFGLTAQGANWAQFSMTRQQSQGAQLLSYTGASLRWATVFADQSAEQGSNTGSNFAIARYSDAGVYLDSPISITRATGVVSFSHSPTVNGASLPYLPIGGGVLGGVLGVGGTGISYNGLGGIWAAHHIGFGWDGAFINGAVDGSSIGQLATVGWVQGTVGGYLPLGGGTLTGVLNCNSNLNVAGSTVHGGNTYFNGILDFVNFYDGRYRYRQWAGNWYDYWDGTTGSRGWSQNGQWMTLDYAGNLATSGTYRAYGQRIISQGSVPSVCAYSSAGVATGFWTDASGMWLGNLDGSGNPFTGSAHVLIDSNGYVTMYNSNARPTAGWTVAGSINVDVAGSTSPGRSGSQGAIWAIGNASAWRMMGTYPNFQQLGVGSWGGQLTYNTQYHPDGGGAWCVDIAGTVTQAGSVNATGFNNYSDGSLKTNVTSRGPQGSTRCCTSTRSVLNSPRPLNSQSRASGSSVSLRRTSKRCWPTR